LKTEINSLIYEVNRVEEKIFKSVELSNMGCLVTLVTWDRKNQANILKQFGVFTQCMFSDE